jgi:hypothetical protein
MLALLELEGLGGTNDGSTPERKWFPDTRAYWTGAAQLRADLAGVRAELARVERERDDIVTKEYKARVERDKALAQLSQLKADIAREKARKEAAAQAAWDKEVEANREKRAALLLAEADQKARVLRDEEAREEAEKAREEVETRRREAIIAAEAARLRHLTAAQKLAELRARRESEYRGARHAGVAIAPDPADDLLEAELVAEVEAEERENIRVEAK